MAYILIIDDDEDFASATAKVIGKAGHETRVELSPASALDAMEERRPDLVLLDVMFPEDASAGFELARKIRHYHDELHGVPILMLTAVNKKFPLGFSSRDIDDNWLPVSDFVEKPVDFDVLLGKVSRLLSAGDGAQSGEGE